MAIDSTPESWALALPGSLSASQLSDKLLASAATCVWQSCARAQLQTPWQRVNIAQPRNEAATSAQLEDLTFNV